MLFYAAIHSTELYRLRPSASSKVYPYFWLREPHYIMALTLTALIFAILTATVKASEFLQPWTAGSTKDYSHNINYALGVHILTEWEADFTNATIALNQDNKPGDAQGGPTVILERKFPSIPF